MSIGTFQTNFSRGELSAKVHTRIDTQSYKDGAREVTNCVIQLQGGARARPGTKSRVRLENGGVPLTANGARLETWIIDRSEVYILSFTNARLDIYRVTASGLTLSQSATSQGWTDTTMWFASMESEGGLFVITDTTFAPVTIVRTAIDTFTVSNIAFTARVDDGELYQPYHKYADFDVTLALSGVTDAWSVGTGRTLTASEAFFDDDHVGKRFLMRDGEIEITSKSSTTICTVEVTREIRAILEPNPFTAHAGSAQITCTYVGHGLSTGDTVNFANLADAPLGGLGALDIQGDRTVVDVLNEDQFTFNAGASSTDGCDFGGSDVWIRSAGATRDWQEPAFSDLRGYPQAVVFHDGRMWLGGPPNAPSARWASRPDNYFHFGLRDGGPADAIKAVGTTGGKIRHMVSGTDLEIFTDKGEAYMPDGIDEGITQANIRQKKQTRYGAAFTRPVRFDGVTLFVDAVGQHVREFLYDDEATNSYTAPPVTALADNVINQPVHATIYDGDDNDATPYAIYTNTDGSAAFFHSARQEGVAGWSSIDTDGTFLSFAGAGERLFVAVTRGTEMFIEEFDWDYIARADGCENLTDAGTTSWTATKDYLKSATIEVFDSAGVWLEQTTTDASGNFTTTNSQTDIWIGLDRAFQIETLPPALGMTDGPLLGARNLLCELIVFLTDTEKIKVNKTTKTFSTNKTGPVAFRGLGWKRDPTVLLSGNISRKCTIPGLRAEVY